jgi:hypothetical protein
MPYAFAGGLANTAAGHGLPWVGRVTSRLRTTDASAILSTILSTILLPMLADRDGEVIGGDGRSAYSEIFGPLAVHESHGARVRGVACI